MNSETSQLLNSRFQGVMDHAATIDLDTAGYELLIAAIGYVLHPDAAPELADALSNAAKLFNGRCRDGRAASFAEALIAVLEGAKAEGDAAAFPPLL